MMITGTATCSVNLVKTANCNSTFIGIAICSRNPTGFATCKSNRIGSAICSRNITGTITYNRSHIRVATCNVGHIGIAFAVAIPVLLPPAVVLLELCPAVVTYWNCNLQL